MEESVRAIVQGARDLLAERGWTKGAMARDGKGEVCGWNGPLAESFCLAGALLRMAGTEGHAAAAESIRGIHRVILREAGRDETLYEDEPDIISWNDHTAKSKDDVLSLLDRVLEKEGERC